MESDSQVQPRVSTELQADLSDPAAPVEVQVDGAGTARSQENILQWISYLPEDCVRTMIEMGWDVTT